MTGTRSSGQPGALSQRQGLPPFRGVGRHAMPRPMTALRDPRPVPTPLQPGRARSGQPSPRRSQPDGCWNQSGGPGMEELGPDGGGGERGKGAARHLPQPTPAGTASQVRGSAGPRWGGARGAPLSPSRAAGRRLAERRCVVSGPGQPMGGPYDTDARPARAVAPVTRRRPRSPRPRQPPPSAPGACPARGLTEALPHRGAERVPQEELHLGQTTRQRPRRPVSRQGLRSSP